MLWMRRALEMEQDVALERGRLTWLCIPAILIYSMNCQHLSTFIKHTLFSCLSPFVFLSVSVLRIEPARLTSKSTRSHIDSTARDSRCPSRMSQTAKHSLTCARIYVYIYIYIYICIHHRHGSSRKDITSQLKMPSKTHENHHPSAPPSGSRTAISCTVGKTYDPTVLVWIVTMYVS